MSHPEDLSIIYKGKLSLAEALKELELTKKSFEISERIESRLSIQDSILLDLQSKVENLASYSYLSTRLEEAKSQTSKIIKDKFEELSSGYYAQLNEKIGRNEIENFISTRCTWIAFNSLTQNVSSLKSRLDKHIFSEFEGLKTKMKVQFGDKYTELMNMTTNIREEFTQIKLRISVLEQKIQEMFADDGLGDSEDYDSQEENDNINQNLGGKDSLESDEEEVNYGAGKGEEKPQIKVSELKSEEDKVQDKSEENKEVGRTEENMSTAPEKIQVRQEMQEVKKEIQSELKQEEIVQKSEVKVEIKKVEENQKEVKQEVVRTEDKSEDVVQPKQEPKIEEPKKEELKIEEPKKVDFKIEEPKKEEPKKVEIKIEEPKKEEPKKEEPKKEEIKTEEPKKTDPDKLSASKGAGLEIPDRPHRRREEDGASSRHRRGGSSAGDALSRKNSMSSAGGGGVGAAASGMRGLNKKLGVLQKDLETFKSSLDENKVTFEEIKSEIGKIYDKISSVRHRCEEIETLRQGMEMSFIKALRRSGKDKKPAAKPAESLNSKDMKKIFDQIHEKTKKITTVETVLDKVALDMKFVKSNLQDKINEIVQAIHGLDSFRKDSTKESTIFESKLSEMEKRLNLFGSSVLSEFETIKGPMADLISDQQRENEILEENLRRQRQDFKEIIDECSLSMKNLGNESIAQSRIGTTRPRTRKSNESPKVSLRHKFFETNNSFRLANPPLKAEENWLASFPDGKTLALPKVGVKKSKASLKGEDLRKSL